MVRSYYAVRVGRKRGIYDSWEEAHAQVHKFANAKYKRFTCWADAAAFMRGEERAALADEPASPSAPAPRAGLPSRTGSPFRESSRARTAPPPLLGVPPDDDDDPSVPIVPPQSRSANS